MIVLFFTVYLKTLDKFVIFLLCYLEKSLKLEERKHNPLTNAWCFHMHPRQTLGTGGHVSKKRVGSFPPGYFQPGVVCRRELSRGRMYLNNVGSLRGRGSRFQSTEGQAWWGQRLSPICAQRWSTDSTSLVELKWGKGLSLWLETPKMYQACIVKAWAGFLEQHT